ncbi:MAG: hypothetical protein H6867_04365 [Rhodospirillales bacterium]|nr:hypothetical protein [Rhodospirillales bacterium]MCB9996384.1 hypothetical protein [Rhodospirillales bacterium]
MSGLPLKLHSIIKYLKDHDAPAAEEKITLRPANLPGQEVIFTATSDNDIHIIAGEVKAARMRLEEIHSGLALSLKSGLANNTVH